MSGQSFHSVLNNHRREPAYAVKLQALWNVDGGRLLCAEAVQLIVLALEQLVVRIDDAARRGSIERATRCEITSQLLDLGENSGAIGVDGQLRNGHRDLLR